MPQAAIHISFQKPDYQNKCLLTFFVRKAGTNNLSSLVEGSVILRNTDYLGQGTIKCPTLVLEVDLHFHSALIAFPYHFVKVS